MSWLVLHFLHLFFHDLHSSIPFYHILEGFFAFTFQLTVLLINLVYCYSPLLNLSSWGIFLISMTSYCTLFFFLENKLLLFYGCHIPSSLWRYFQHSRKNTLLPSLLTVSSGMILTLIVYAMPFPKCSGEASGSEWTSRPKEEAGHSCFQWVCKGVIHSDGFLGHFPSLWLFPLHPNHRPGVWPCFDNLSSHSHHFTGDKYPHYPCLTQSAVCVCVCVCTHAPACSCSGSFNQFPVSYSWILSSQDLPPLVMKLLLMLRSRLGYVSSFIALSQSILLIYSDLHSNNNINNNNRQKKTKKKKRPDLHLLLF